MSLRIIDRLQFIEANYLDISNTILFPLLSAMLIVSVYPFASTVFLKIWLIHKKRQMDIKNEIEKNQLLTLEQSIDIRKSIQKQEEEFNKVVDAKEKEIVVLENQITELKNEKEKLLTLEQTLEIKTSLQKQKEEFSKEIDTKDVEIVLLKDRITAFEKIKETYEQLLEHDKNITFENETLKKEVNGLSNRINNIDNHIKESPLYKELDREFRRVLNNESELSLKLNDIKNQREELINQIHELKHDNNQLTEKIIQLEKELLSIKDENTPSQLSKELRTIISNQQLRKHFETIIELQNSNPPFLPRTAIPATAIQYFQTLGLMQDQGGLFILTPKGKEFATEFVLKVFDDEYQIKGTQP